MANHSARSYDKTSRKGMSILSAIEKYIPLNQRDDRKRDPEEIKRNKEQHDRASYLLTYYELNKKHVNLPDECYDREIRAYLTLAKIANRTDLRISEFRTLSLSTAVYLSELHIVLVSEGKQGIMECSADNKDDWYVSFDKLDNYIRSMIRANQSIAERLESEINEIELIEKKLLGYNLKEEKANSDIGAVKLKPFYVTRFKIDGVTVEDPDGQDWSVEDMKKLAAELLAAAEIKEKRLAQK